MSATETVVASLPSRALNHPEIIDVDALDDHTRANIEFAGCQRPPAVGPLSTRQSLAADGLAYMGFRRGAAVGRPSRMTSAQAASNATASGSRGGSEEIIVLESDEDEGESSSASRRRFGRNRSRLISPPPPPPERGNTPAVPAVPPHLSSQTFLPIRPSVRPLPFETQMAARMAAFTHIPPRGSAPIQPVPAPRSHHRPAMGLGGALIALNRQNSLAENIRRERNAATAHSFFNLPTFTEIYRRLSRGRGGYGAADAPDSGPGEGRWTRFWSWTGRAGARNVSTFLADDDALDLEDAFDFDPLRYPGLADLARSQAPEKAVHWRPEYTHPDKAGPGFSYDFAPMENSSLQSSGASSPNVIVLDDDEAGSSSAGSSSNATALETTLVCARCLDPLVLAAPDGASAGEQKRCRVWALRCGHMLDGKCISHLMDLPATAHPEPAEMPTGGKGKGKARALDEVPPILANVRVHSEDSGARPAVGVSASTSDRKGKRKAVEPLEPESPKHIAIADSSDEGNTYRSRLRSHARAVAEVNAPSDDQSNAGSSSRTVHTPRRRQLGTATSAATHQTPSRRAKGKGKARARGGRKPKVEAEHEWKCPVAACGRPHYSVRVLGEWRNDEERGGIALFL